MLADFERVYQQAYLMEEIQFCSRPKKQAALIIFSGNRGKAPRQFPASGVRTKTKGPNTAHVMTLM